MSRRIWGAIALLVLLIGIFFVFHLIGQQKRYERAYEWLNPGSDRVQVLMQFGQPTRIGKCDLTPAWGATPVSKDAAGCVDQFWYLSWVSPEEWVIGFDSHGKAVTKYYFVSP